MELRLLSYNIHKGLGWRSRKPTFDLLRTHLHELQHDIIFLQEILTSQFDAFSDSSWGHWLFGKNCVHKSSHLGNAIISKFPIEYICNLDISMHRLEHRGMLHAITTIHEQRLHLICVHLGLFPRDRQVQLTKIIEYVKAAIPEQAPLIIAGDFNDWSSYADKPLKEHLHLSEGFLAVHAGHARTYPAWSPVFKLDRVYFRGMKIKEANRLIKRPWNLLSDHLAIETIFEIT